MSSVPSPALPEEIRALDAASRRSRTASGDGEMVWREWGEGEPLLLLHGSHGNWMHWLRNIPDIAQYRHVIAPDMPGYGESAPPADLRSPAEHAQTIIAGLDALGLDRPIDIVGFSLGALIGSYMALEAPERVRRLVYVDAPGLGTLVVKADVRSMRGLSGEMVRQVNRHNLHATMIHDPARIDETAIDISMAGGRGAKSEVHWQVIPDKLLAIVDRVRAPIDLIWAEHDFIHPGPEDNAQVVRRFQPEAELHPIADAGHWVMYEQPAAFNAALRDLLSRPARASGNAQPVRAGESMQ